ncbi:heparan-alpha-glucosaminide N-acetyltransferase [Sporomusa termitida]|uniref:Heparan-alpha-glucosaminide N-acetyltransferase catalytic domain-containing protein n=1 Tax=Sporomusa termitida TaxID=2377 RepID=A0A517E1C9_9FIRM|nr:heparan-alpha-glucosaminide N-acetyltransferase [Sporomusa termitida]QDR83306.1 hypothetical protein SPTER_47900 [Sporomusa termitida]
MSNAVRLVELDILRGIAILLMVIFHTIFDLAFFYNWPLNYLEGFWYYQGKAAALLFMLISGISNVLSRRPVRRGLIVFGTGLFITAITYCYNPAVYIRFGILHLLGAAMLATPLLNRGGALPLSLAGTAIIAIGNAFSQLTATTAWLLPFGLRPPEFTSLDYYPLLPWLGIILYGMVLGKLLYPAGQTRWPAAADYRFLRWLSWLGRRSLLIYLIHQPVILALLQIIKP